MTSRVYDFPLYSRLADWLIRGFANLPDANNTDIGYSLDIEKVTFGEPTRTFGAEL